MKDKCKYMFLRYIYNKLGLKEVENNLSEGGIIDLNLESSDISKYFRIVNEIDEDALTVELRKKYNYYFSHSIEKLCGSAMEKELFAFFEENYSQLFFPKVDDKYIYYGTINSNYMAPRDSIVLGFYYNEFDIQDENFDEKHFQNDVLICDNLNFIQYVLGPKFNMKISVIKYNEFSLKKNFVR